MLEQNLPINRNNSTVLPQTALADFEGPLDLLLDEVRRQNVAIEYIALAPMVARFLGYVRTALAEWGKLDVEWLQMAATLIHWKSRSLLRRESPGGSDVIRDELIGQLKRHRQALAAGLEERQSAQSKMIPRLHGTPLSDAESTAGAFVSAWDLVRQAKELAQWIVERRITAQATEAVVTIDPDEVSVAEKEEYLRNALMYGPLNGSRLLIQQPTAQHRCSLFLAMLEMARNKEIRINQDGCFSSMQITKC